MRIARDEVLASNWRAIDEQSSVITLRNSGCLGVAEDSRENSRKSFPPCFGRRPRLR